MTPAQKKDFDRAIKFANHVRAIRIAAQGHSDETGKFHLPTVYRVLEPYIDRRQWRGLLGSMKVQGLYTPIKLNYGRIVTHGKI
jgi:hypothetical protein